jgi:hypothetical protein
MALHFSDASICELKLPRGWRMTGPNKMPHPVIPSWALLAAVALTAGSLLATPLRAEPPRPARAPLGEREMTIENRSDKLINEVYVSPSSTDQWGEDRLGEATLEPGGALRIRLGRTRDCSFDVQVVYEDASREERVGQDVCRSRRLTFDGSAATMRRTAEAPVRRVTLQNHSARPIVQVYISPADSAQWGEDQLTTGRIGETESAEIAYSGDCAADLRVVFANRAAEERRGLDLCAMPTVSIEPGWTTAEPLPGVSAPRALTRQ